MADGVRAKVLVGFCISPGVDAVVGEIVSLDPALHRWMLGRGHIEPVEDAPEAPAAEPAPEPTTDAPADPAAVTDAPARQPRKRTT